MRDIPSTFFEKTTSVVCLFFMLKLLQYCNYIIIVMQIKLMLLLLLLLVVLDAPMFLFKRKMVRRYEEQHQYYDFIQIVY